MKKRELPHSFGSRRLYVNAHFFAIESGFTSTETALWHALRQYSSTRLSDYWPTMSDNSLKANTSPRYARDKLTGALARPHFIDLLKVEKRLADRNGRQFMLFLIDVDQMRGLNLKVGHAVGDELLFGLANRLRDTLDLSPWDNTNYLHARFDGDALMLMLRSCRLEQGQRLAETIRSRIAATEFAGGLRISVSIGVAGYCIGESVDDLLGRVEQTLFLAKQCGRDRVEVAAELPPRGEPSNVIYYPFTHSR